MNIKKIIKCVAGLSAVGGIAYAAYKFGECNGEANAKFRDKYGDNLDDFDEDDDEDEDDEDEKPAKKSKGKKSKKSDDDDDFDFDD